MKTVRRWIAMLALLAPVGSCVVVDGDNCREAADRCDGELIEECIDDNWEVVDDCWDFCGGYCDYDRYGNAVCVC